MASNGEALVNRHLQFIESSDTFSFRVVSWNILANQYARYQHNRPYRVLEQHFREPLLRAVFERFMEMDIDFICLQEVDVKVALQTLGSSYTRLLTPTGHGHGDTRVDACCIFFRTDRWKLLSHEIVNMDDLADLPKPTYETRHYGTKHIENAVARDETYKAFVKSFLRNNFGILAMLENRKSGISIVLANTHLYWDPEYEYVKLCQIHHLVHSMKKFVFNYEGVPIVLCGDLNSLPGSAVHTYLSKGVVDAKSTVPSGQHLKGLLQVEEWLSKEELQCPFQLKSAYDELELLDSRQRHEGERSFFTNVTSKFVGCLDYVFYQPSSLVLVKRLPLPKSLRQLGGDNLIPNDFWPSDHLAVGAELMFGLEP